VVAGGCDQNITAAVLRQSLLQRAHAASLEIIPGVGHLLPLEARDQVAAIILRSVRDPQNVAKTEAKCTK
jgi:pimeloyl-ACP methyl ester carboxylesterase